MTHPIPLPPENITTENTYAEIDRGYFVVNRDGVSVIARVVEAEWICRGPEIAQGILKFKLKTYGRNIPSTPEAVHAGEPLLAPNGSEWFDTATRGAVHHPIMAEYWANWIMRNHYNKDGALLLSEGERMAIEKRAKAFANTTILDPAFTALEVKTVFGIDAIGALSRVSATITYEASEVDPVVIPVPAGDFNTYDVLRAHLPKR